MPPPLLRWPGLSSLPFPAAITHHPAHPRGWRWPAPVSPPQHLRQSKENSSNHPAALQLLIMLISVPESYQPQKEKAPGVKREHRMAGQYCPTQALVSALSCPPGQGYLSSIWGKKKKEHFQITHLQKSYPTCLGKSSGARRPRGYMGTELDTVRLWPFS